MLLSVTILIMEYSIFSIWSLTLNGYLMILVATHVITRLLISEIYPSLGICIWLYVNCILLIDFILIKVVTITKNTVISSDFLVWKLCAKTQFPHSFGQFAQPISGQCSHFIPPENTRKPLVLWCFQEV